MPQFPRPLLVRVRGLRGGTALQNVVDAFEEGMLQRRGCREALRWVVRQQLLSEGDCPARRSWEPIKGGVSALSVKSPSTRGQGHGGECEWRGSLCGGDGQRAGEGELGMKACQSTAPRVRTDRGLPGQQA